MQNYNLEVETRKPSSIDVKLGDLSQNESDTLARVILHGINQAFKDPAIAAEYERWKQKRSTKTATVQAAGSK